MDKEQYQEWVRDEVLEYDTISAMNGLYIIYKGGAYIVLDEFNQKNEKAFGFDLTGAKKYFNEKFNNRD